MSNGLMWAIEGAQVMGCREWQDKSGQPHATVELAYFGGKVDVEAEPSEAHRIGLMAGKVVSASGPLSVDENRFGTRVHMGLAAINEIKK